MKKLFLIVPLLVLLLTGCSLQQTAQEKLDEALLKREIYLIDIENDRIGIEKCNSVGAKYYKAVNSKIYCDGSN